MKTKHASEQEARSDARKYGETYVQIIESRGDFYLETDDDMAMIRSWERLAYLGDGKDA